MPMNRRDLLTAASATGLGALFGPTARAAAGKDAHPAITEVMHHVDRARSGVMLGGVGAGGGELRKDGRFCNWTIFNNSPRGTGPRAPFSSDTTGDNVMFFTMRYELPGQEPRMKVLQIEDGHEVATVPTHIYEFPWLTGIDKIEYAARFPHADLVFTDPEMPLEVRMRAEGFFVPHDIDASSLPCIVFSFTVTNTGTKPIDAMLIGSQRDCVGYDYKEKLYTSSIKEGPGWKLFEQSANNLPDKHGTAGSMALASLSADSTHYVGWEHRHPYYERVLRAKQLPNIDEMQKRTQRDRKTGKRWALDRAFSSLAKSATLAPKASFQHTFVMTWFFPNMYNESHSYIEGNHYAAKFSSATDVAEHVITHKDELAAKTKGFVDALYETTVDQFVLDQIDSQLNTFVTSSFYSKVGNFGILEGILPDQNMGPLATTDVSVYGAWPIAAFFPDLKKATMRAHRNLQTPAGEMGHSLQRDFGKLLRNVAGAGRRLDLHPQYVSMVLRDFFWTDDRKYLEEMWPSIKRALDYVLKERDLNGDSMPDMEGIMSSYDNFPMYGAASYIGSQWIAALTGAVEAAKALGDKDAETRYGDVLGKCKRIFEDKLWNGSYYRLWNDDGGKHGGKDEGCLTDQIIGQWGALPVGLGELFPKEHVTTALKTIMKMSYRPGFGLRNCSWPDGVPWKDIPDDIWVDQANTCWSGVELAFASFLIYEGLWDDGLKVVKTVDERYRRAGRYWDHQEFGGHYYRPMAAWMILNAMLGMSLNQSVLAFAPTVPPKALARGLRVFFATPTATAHYVQKNNEAATVEVKTGEMVLKGLDVTFATAPNKQKAKVMIDKKPLSMANVTVNVDQKTLRLRFSEPLKLTANQSITVARS